MYSYISYTKDLIYMDVQVGAFLKKWKVVM